ncbi:putative Tubulin binding cofactor C [Trypanosoma vivax]|uniref:C-CAP/cofactor C-like domain-containing protein n=1 Tax=Trypanosoma vivax (strain Y486) TaxID=1055687 RepID=F9WQV2_TRYVY|nr:putative Tubulin binding cofactor C [Trypanosoma vivax]CCD19934.1 hypothetical protein, conserved in T. vivax [Trypanosoma vivax Y486]|eukprot:CCD19934.1 hypothetical protein, conserved in T. vivax [Trypanosoma vivax Y486]
MEEKFLRLRAEREGARQQKAAEPSDNALERLRFEEKARGLEEVITKQLSDGDARAAQETLNVLKGEVQDATANNILTAYEMAKSNTSLSRLQELIDAKGERGQGRKAFKFSASSKVRCATVADTSVGVTAAQGQEEVLGCRDNVFGDARKKDLFLSPSKALFLRNCRECGVFVLPVAGSIFISDCAQCTIYVACQQLRLKNCTDINVYVSCSSRPIIECCTEMRFGSYSCWVGLLNSTVGEHRYDSHEEWMKQVGEMRDPERAADMYRSVDDFQWLRKTPSPNWRVLKPEEQVVCTQPFIQEGHSEM